MTVADALSKAAERTLPALPGTFDAPLGLIAGTAAYRIAGGAREAVRANMRVIAPGSPHEERLVRDVFVHQVRNYLEIFRIPRQDPQALLAHVATVGFEHFVEAHARGRGVVAASAHLGPVSLVGQTVLVRGYEVVLPIEAETSELSRAINRARRGMGLKLVATGAPLGIHRILRRGGTLGIIVDRAVTRVGERVPFFGHETLMPSAHVVLAMRTGATLLPAFARRDDAGRPVAEFLPAMELAASGDNDADVRENVARFAAIIERYVRRTPEQWAVFERFWPDA